jgi:hypothetical protein
MKDLYEYMDKSDITVIEILLNSSIAVSAQKLLEKFVDEKLVGEEFKKFVKVLTKLLKKWLGNATESEF